MNRPLTARQRHALAAVERGQVRPAPTRAGIDYPPTVNVNVLVACRRRGWWTWRGPRAVLTAEGRAELAKPIPEPTRVLHTGVIGSDTTDRCANPDCKHVRGAHGVQVLGERVHLDCLYAGCECKRFIAAGEDTGADHGYISGRDRLEAGMAVDEFTQERFTKAARQRDAERRRVRNDSRSRDRELLEAEDRIKELRLRARASHVDLTSEIRLVESLRAASSEASRVRALRKIEEMERRLDAAA